jgi:hypothetical protein
MPSFITDRACCRASHERPCRSAMRDSGIAPAGRRRARRRGGRGARARAAAAAATPGARLRRLPGAARRPRGGAIALHRPGSALSAASRARRCGSGELRLLGNRGQRSSPPLRRISQSGSWSWNPYTPAPARPQGSRGMDRGTGGLQWERAPRGGPWQARRARARRNRARRSAAGAGARTATRACAWPAAARARRRPWRSPLCWAGGRG